MKTTPDVEKPEVSQYIKFGKTKFSDYSKMSVLGRGTYGEVTKCLHIDSGYEVAVKTFFFDVRLDLSFS